MSNATFSCKFPHSSKNSKEELSEGAIDGIVFGAIAVGGVIGGYILIKIAQMRQTIPLATVQPLLGENYRFAEARLNSNDSSVSQIFTIAQEVQDSGNPLEEQITEAIPLLREVAQQQQLREALNASLQRAGNAVLQSNPVERIVGTALEESV